MSRTEPADQPTPPAGGPSLVLAVDGGDKVSIAMAAGGQLGELREVSTLEGSDGIVRGVTGFVAEQAMGPASATLVTDAPLPSWAEQLGLPVTRAALLDCELHGLAAYVAEEPALQRLMSDPDHVALYVGQTERAHRIAMFNTGEEGDVLFMEDRAGEYFGSGERIGRLEPWTRQLGRLVKQRVVEEREAGRDVRLVLLGGGLGRAVTGSAVAAFNALLENPGIGAEAKLRQVPIGVPMRAALSIQG